MPDYNVLDEEQDVRTTAKSKEVKLINYLRSLGKVLVAYSGGVDSTYLMAMAREILGEKAMAVFAKGAMISHNEEHETLERAKLLNFTPIVIDMDILALEQFVNNPPDRCYFCKKHIFTTFVNLAKKHEISSVLDGTNFSDNEDFRPGRKALEELHILSPLWEVGLTKEEIRELSRLRNLPTWNKPSMACLASRIPFGEQITADLLKLVADSEHILDELGFLERRVRVHSDIARIEIPFAKFTDFLVKRNEVIAKFQLLGFCYVTLDLLGLRSGSMNPIPKGAAKNE